MFIITKFLPVVGLIFSGILSYLFIIVVLPVLKKHTQPIKTTAGKADVPDCRKTVTFTVDNVDISGWLYLPENTAGPVPCIVLNSGFCGTKDVILEQYALRFVEAGFAALSFDYRHFGESGGNPRQHYSIKKQLEDLHSAIAYVRDLPEIDPENIIVWGTSSSGNYGLAIAAVDQRIAAIIGQTPSLDHKADGDMIVKRDGIGWLLKILLHAQRDKGRARIGLAPHTIPAVGRPGTLGMLIAPGTYEGYARFFQTSKTFRNEVCARLMFESHGPNPIECAKKITCPAQFFICEKDNIVAPDSYKKIAEILGNLLELHLLPIDHFSIYEGVVFQTTVNQQINFIRSVIKKS